MPEGVNSTNPYILSTIIETFHKVANNFRELTMIEFSQIFCGHRLRDHHGAHDTLLWLSMTEMFDDVPQAVFVEDGRSGGGESYSALIS